MSWVVAAWVATQKKMRVFACSVSPVANQDVPKAALAVENGNVELWDIGLQSSKRHLSRVRTARHGSEETLRTAWSNDGSVIISGGSDGLLKLWDGELGFRSEIALEVKEPEDQAVYATWFRKGDREVCVAYDDLVCGYDAESRTRIWKHKFDRAEQLVTPRNVLGKRLVFDAHEQAGNSGLVSAALSDGSFTLVDSKSNSLVRRIDAHSAATTSCRFSTNSVVTASVDGTACVWDMRTWKKTFVTPSLKTIVYGAHFIKEESVVLAWARNALLWWDVSNSQQGQMMELEFPVICVDQGHGILLACGELEEESETCRHGHSHAPDPHGTGHSHGVAEGSCHHHGHSHSIPASHDCNGKDDNSASANHDERKRTKQDVKGLLAIPLTNLLN